MNTTSRWVVCKFGGASVASKNNWENIRTIVVNHVNEGKNVLLVCSALQGVTDMLEAAISAASQPIGFRALLEQLASRHWALAAQMEIETGALIGPHLERLESLLEACVLCGERPDLRAHVLAHGELMSTLIGTAFLEKAGLTAHWFDARKALVARERSVVNGPRYFLSAQCDDDPDDSLAQWLGQMGSLLVTQGFIASTPSGETALLGRGGSDTSAAYFAAKIRAECLEIWTDVPGMFTANPHHVPQARILNRLTYDEAEVLASNGAKVLHARCVAPVRKNQIPIRIKWTVTPSFPGTVIARLEDGAEVEGVCALTTRANLFLVKARVGPQGYMDALSKVISYLKDHDIQVDSFTSANGRLLMVLDPLLCNVSEEELASLFSDERWLELQILKNVSSLTLVGHAHGMLYGALSQLFATLDPERMLSLGNSTGMDETILIEQAELDDMVGNLHRTLLHREHACDIFGPTWNELQRFVSV